MAHTLLLRLSAPLQSWGVQSNFAVRDTAREPTKSGVIGILCASLGRNRAESLHDLQRLRMGVRVDQEGVVYRDFHTAQQVYKASGGIKDTEPSTRYFLADARFLVGLESEQLDLLEELQTALEQPHWTQFLGRKAFVPGEPIWLRDGLRKAADLRTALTSYPWLGCDPTRCRDSLRLVIESPAGPVQHPDQPLSFAERTFSMRSVEISYIDTPESIMEDSLCIYHA